jgi:Uncharacterized low-complexity proteins
MTLKPTRNIQSQNTDNIFEQAKQAGLDPTEAFSKADLSGFNLSRADLRNFNLSGTVLSGTDLSHAKLNGAKLHDAQICGANLTDANLCGAQLPDADLSGADLCRANLSGANLSRVNVRGAKFGGSLGLTEDTKRDLKSRGANFEDFTGGEKSFLEKDFKWWIQHVIVPLVIAFVGSGGIIAIATGVKGECPSTMPVPSVKPTTQATPASTAKPTTKPTIQMIK